MRNVNIVGSTVALTLCPATDKDGNELQISGLFDVEEFHPCEPSAYVWSPYYTLFPHDGDKDDPDAFLGVDAYAFFEQTEPQAFGRELALERESLWAQERQDMDDRFGNNRTILDAGFRQ